MEGNQEGQVSAGLNSKPAFASKMILLNLVAPALLYVPGVGPVLSEFVKANPEMVLTAWGAINLALRQLTSKPIRWPWQAR